MSKKPIIQFFGHLDPQQIADGINAARRSALRLYEDAEILLGASRFPSACALAILSIEESGKQAVLRRMSTAKDEKERKKIWRYYRNHKTKNAAWIILQLAASGAKTLEDMRPMVDPASEHPAELDTIKQIAFYSDCYGDGHWSEPHEVIDETLCRSLVTTARVLLSKTEMTLREIELWIEHVGPHADGPTFEGPREFYRAMKAEGLSDYDDAHLDTFLGISRINQSL